MRDIPAQVLTPAEIEGIRQSFMDVFLVNPIIKQTAHDLAFTGAGVKLVMQFSTTQSKETILEIVCFHVPKPFRHKGLGSLFIHKLFTSGRLIERFKTIRLIPANEKACLFWEKMGFTIRSNLIFLHYNKRNVFE